MQRLNTRAVVLSRRDYGEADRIVTFITEEQGRLSGLVKGVRKPKSRLAGGIELFCVSNISFLDGQRELKPVVAADLTVYYSNIAKNVEKTLWAYDVLKLMQKFLPESYEREYFDLICNTLKNLDDETIDLWAVKLKFYLSWLELHGQQINVQLDFANQPLEESKQYHFSVEDKAFVASQFGPFGSSHIKLLRLTYANDPSRICRVEGAGDLANPLNLVLVQAAKLVV